MQGHRGDPIAHAMQETARGPIASAVRKKTLLEPVLSTSGLTVRFGDFIALRDVSIDLAPRSIRAIIGPNGAGKTTLFNAISGFARPSHGAVRLHGSDVTGLAPNRLAHLGLARSFQICSIFPDLTVAANIRLALMRREGGLALLGARSAADGFDTRIRTLLAKAGLTAEATRRAGDLAYGRRRMLEIATTLALDPAVLMLDEPTSGLAREDIAPVTGLIREAAGTCTVLLVEHNLGVVESLATEVTVLAEGAVLCTGTYHEVASDPRVLRAYIGEVPHA
jgi:branched-chain amino acid transport system ATP-binding protein